MTLRDSDPFMSGAIAKIQSLLKRQLNPAQTTDNYRQRQLHDIAKENLHKEGAG